ncbi:hypothetical protein PR048_023796 [Dryococelus australis]|uniref:Uncharacterized protein n=1 Tax=Dryococelus australis TaxID=614101 RepID=A0ABQ9GV91_9NEOP|nr:hypothetical protein PR048_023796 [Dryococelus australis]
MERRRNAGAGGKHEILEQTRRSAASSCTIHTSENLGATRPGIEHSSPWWEASRLTAQPPRLKLSLVLKRAPASGRAHMRASKDSFLGSSHTLAPIVLALERLPTIWDSFHIPDVGRFVAIPMCLQLPSPGAWLAHDQSGVWAHIDLRPQQHKLRSRLASKGELRLTAQDAEVLRADEDEMRWNIAGMKGWGKRGDPEKTRQPAASSGTIPTSENSGVARPGIKPSSPRWEASSLTAQPLRLRGLSCNYIFRENYFLLVATNTQAVSCSYPRYSSTSAVNGGGSGGVRVRLLASQQAESGFITAVFLGRSPIQELLNHGDLKTNQVVKLAWHQRPRATVMQFWQPGGLQITVAQQGMAGSGRGWTDTTWMQVSRWKKFRIPTSMEVLKRGVGEEATNCNDEDPRSIQTRRQSATSTPFSTRETFRVGSAKQLTRTTANDLSRKCFNVRTASVTDCFGQLPTSTVFAKYKEGDHRLSIIAVTRTASQRERRQIIDCEIASSPVLDDGPSLRRGKMAGHRATGTVLTGVERFAWLKGFCTSEVQKRGSARDDRGMRFNALIAFTRRALNWRAVLPTEVSVERRRNARAGLPEKTRLLAASSWTISTCENQGATPPGIEPCLLSHVVKRDANLRISRGTVGRRAAGVWCGRFWVRIPGEAWLLVQSPLSCGRKPGRLLFSFILLRHLTDERRVDYAVIRSALSQVPRNLRHPPLCLPTSKVDGVEVELEMFRVAAEL